MKIIRAKFIESTISILPVVLIVFLTSRTPLINLTNEETIVFLISSFFLIVGMALFNIGAELSMTPMGDHVGAGILKTNKLTLILLITFIMGFVITVAEPDLVVLANQVKKVVKASMFIISVGVGVGVFLVISLLRVIYNQKLSLLLLLFYLLLFAIVALFCEEGKGSLLPLVFDSGGVTTGPMTVPFIMAFGIGIATTLGGKNSNENSFGFVALCSIGPMIVVILTLLATDGNIVYTSPDYTTREEYNIVIMRTILEHVDEVRRALLLIFLIFLVLNFFIMKFRIKKIMQILIGLIITFVGIVLFLSSASIGFLPTGYVIGRQIGLSNTIIATMFCFVLGMTVVLAEPAIHVLTSQVEDVTGGTVTKKSMLIALCIGVGLAIALSIFRIIKEFSILYYLIPGYFLSLALSLFVPPIYTAIAFDSGGVASGPLTSTFILPFMIGAAIAASDMSKVMSLAFGVVALVAMTPLISIQLLGFRAIVSKKLRDKISMGRILRADDNQIVYFEV